MTCELVLTGLVNWNLAGVTNLRPVEGGDLIVLGVVVIEATCTSLEKAAGGCSRARRPGRREAGLAETLLAAGPGRLTRVTPRRLLNADRLIG